MHGVITAWDSAENKGRIQGDDGGIYAFELKVLHKSDYQPAVGMACDFMLQQGKVSTLELCDPKAFMENQQRFSLPPQIIVSENEELPPGYTLFAKANCRIRAGARRPEQARQSLIAAAARAKCTALIDLKCAHEARRGMGFAYAWYVLSAVPAIAVKADDEGEFSKTELKSRLNIKYLTNLSQKDKRQRALTFALRFAAVLLFIVFALGFFLAS